VKSAIQLIMLFSKWVYYLDQTGQYFFVASKFSHSPPKAKNYNQKRT